jgi:hypothetical protein
MVLWLPTEEADISLFGITADGSTDEQILAQRMMIQQSKSGIAVVGSGALGGTPSIMLKSPVAVCAGNRMREVYFTSPSSGFAPVDGIDRTDPSAPRAGAMLISANCGTPGPQTFTAVASTDTFTCGTDPGHVVGNTIMFNDPYGAGLPGGVVAGRVYYIKTKPSGTTFTISATTGGSTLDVTSDGGGYMYTRISSLIRVFWDSIRIDVNQQDLNGFFLNLQQPGYIRNLRIELNGSGPTTPLSEQNGIGFFLTGQVAFLYHLEINPRNGTLAMIHNGQIMPIYGVTMNAAGRGILYKDCDSSGIFGAELEQLTPYAIKFSGNNRGHSLANVFWSAPTTTEPLFQIESGSTGTTAFTVAGVRTPATSNKFLDDPDTSTTLYWWSGSGISNTSDAGLTIQDFYKTIPSSGAPPRYVFGAQQAARVLSAKAVLDFPSISAGGSQELTITVTGAATGDIAVASPNTFLEANLTWAAYVNAADTVTIRVTNPTTGPIDPSSRTWRAAVLNFEAFL